MAVFWHMVSRLGGRYIERLLVVRFRSKRAVLNEEVVRVAYNEAVNVIITVPRSESLMRGSNVN